ncbi:molybdenum cofactor guanylyltransferase [Cryobacterium sp. AP23]
MHPDPSPASPSFAPAPRWDAIIVAGGRANRLGGIDKTALLWHGRTLLDGAVTAVAGAGRLCVVGSDADLPASVVRTVEEPRWGGPAAAIAAGLAALAAAHGADSHTGADTDADIDADWVVVLAGDLVRPGDAVTALLAELGTVRDSPEIGGQPAVIDGVITLDAGGRRQPLLAVYRRAALVAAARRLGSAENLAVNSLIGGLNLVELRLSEALSDDVDTPADAARLGIVLPAPAGSPATPQRER